jgi:rod shape-determining protein MreD
MKPAPHALFWLSLLGALVLQLAQLPASIAAARPMWIPLTLAYWALTEPRVPTLLASLLFGLILDVVFDNLLGQNTLGLALLVFFVARLRTLFGLIPMWQAMIVLTPLWGLYAVLMFWIDGLSRHDVYNWLRWLPVLSTTLFWPLVHASLDALRRRQPSDD